MGTLWPVAKRSRYPNREESRMRTILVLMVAIAALQCSTWDTDGDPQGSGGQTVTMTVTVDNFSAAADIETVDFTVTHKEVFYGTSITLTFDSSAITYSGTIQNVPAGPIDFQVHVLGAGSRALCSLTGTCTVPSRSPVTLSRQLSDPSCGIPKAAP